MSHDRTVYMYEDENVVFIKMDRKKIISIMCDHYLRMFQENKRRKTVDRSYHRRHDHLINNPCVSFFHTQPRIFWLQIPVRIHQLLLN